MSDYSERRRVLDQAEDAAWSSLSPELREAYRKERENRRLFYTSRTDNDWDEKAFKRSMKERGDAGPERRVVENREYWAKRKAQQEGAKAALSK